ncbi:hypothetical protein M2266_005858 [Streptomyces sp. SPB162]|nr:hypothetical protein [Streptomyces sp. SPB162]
MADAGPTDTPPVAARMAVAAGAQATASLRDGGTPRTAQPPIRSPPSPRTNSRTPLDDCRPALGSSPTGNQG